MGGPTASQLTTIPPPPPLCDIPSGCCFFTEPWTVTRCYDLQKYKSDVYRDVFKLREVVSHAKHPFRGGNKRMGRVLSVLWSQAATILQSMETISMNEVLPWVRKIKGKPTGYWLELDLKEMFMSIPREAVVTALTHCLEAIASKGHRQTGLLFSISKDGNRKRVLPFACCVGSLLSVGRCGRCCRFRVRAAQWLVCWGYAGCGRMCRSRVSGAQ